MNVISYGGKRFPGKAAVLGFTSIQLHNNSIAILKKQQYNTIYISLKPGPEFSKPVTVMISRVI
jgi:hypothetical protein